MVAAPARLCQVLSQLAVGQRGSGQAGIGAGLVQRYRVKRGKHADIRQDGCVILPVAVAVGADVLHQADMEAGAACTDSGGILCHLAVQLLIGAVVQGVDGVKVARTDAAAAALALVVIDHSLIVLVVGDGVRAALRCTAAAAAAQPLLHAGRAGGVLLHLACTGAAAHADVLDGAAEAGSLVALEVVQADEHIRIHDGPADLGRLAVLAPRHRHFHLVGAPQTVGDQHLAAGGHGPKAVELGAVQVLQRIFAAAGVQGVAVGQKGHTALLLAQVCHRLCVVGAQKSQVAQLSKVHLDGHEPAIHIDLADACRQAQAAQLLGQAGAHRAAEVGKVNGGRLHKSSSLTVAFRRLQQKTL